MGAITVKNLGKAYKHYPNRWGRLVEWLMPGKKRRHTLNWVLRDISFTVTPGEAVGIVGINGAGKSTLLKMITGTTQATTGSVALSGRVAAMLELGMGFHPEFTGRQNVYMAGQLLGYSVEELTRLMPKIEAFAEIGDYIEKPVRIYSSGMQMRLAFSVATARRPDILIVDEALSVGDTYFQHKSFDRIREYRSQGTTLLIVSHDKLSIQSICDRAILLSAGALVMEGEPEAVMDYYNAMLADPERKTVIQSKSQAGSTQTCSGSGEVRVTEVAIYNEAGRKLEFVSVGQPITLQIKVVCVSAVEDLVVGYLIKDRLGREVFGTNTYHHHCRLTELSVGQSVTLEFDFNVDIGAGSYSISTACHTEDSHISKNFEWRDRALIFDVINVDQKEFVGVAWIPPTIRLSYE